MHEVVHDREDRTRGVDTQGDPPEQLLVQPLLEVLQHQETDRQARQGARQVGDVRHRRAHLLRRVPVVNREPHVGAGCNQKDKTSVRICLDIF